MTYQRGVIFAILWEKLMIYEYPRVIARDAPDVLTVIYRGRFWYNYGELARGTGIFFILSLKEDMYPDDDTCGGKPMLNAKRKMQQFCETIADSLQIGIMAAHTDGIICYMNATFARMFGFDRVKAVGDTIRNYFPEAELLNVINSREKQVRVLFRFNGIEAFISRYPVFDGGVCIGGYVEAYFRDIQELQALLSRIDSLERKARYFERRAQAGLPGATFTFNDLVGISEPMRRLKKQGIRFANSDQPVLITGESGTGKELIANALHAASPRAQQIFVTVNCAAIPEELMEAELFGYEEGAFTGARRGGRIGKFELADRGTIFLDEIAEMPLNMQAKLLRILENREIQKIGGNEKINSDFRVIAATNKDLAQLLREGRFREDLYYRLNVLHLHSPPLRERFDDLPLLLAELLRQIATQEHGPVPEIDKAILPLLTRYHWPGNVRELKNVLIYTRFSMKEGEQVITARNLPPHLLETNGRAEDGEREDLKTQYRKFIYSAIERALVRCNGNKARTARELGISRNELYKKMKMLGMELALGRLTAQ